MHPSPNQSLMNPNMNIYQAERSPIESISAAYQPYGMGKKFLSGQDAISDLSQIQHCAIADLTHLPRLGFRGVDSASFLNQAGFSLPEKPNTFVVQADGSTVARLSATEYLLLAGWSDFGESIIALEQRWHLSAEQNYLLPRQDSHAWLQLLGSCSAAVMAKLCAVDLSAEAFSPGQIAQTSVARINAIVINVSDAQSVKFNILCDRASALYLWHVLLDAIAEFDGQVVGIDALVHQG